MPFVSEVPFSNPVVPQSIVNSLPRHHNGVPVYGLIREFFDILRHGREHPLVTADRTYKGLSRNDYTTLSKDQTESTELIERMAREAQGLWLDPDSGQWRQILKPDGTKLHSIGMCIHGMIKNESKVNPHLTRIAQILKETPKVRIAFVNNYDSHGTLSADTAAADVRRCIAAIRETGATNPIDVDTVLDYQAWVEAYKPGTDAGRAAAAKGQAHEKLLAVWHACEEEGALLKIIQKACVHAWNPRDFDSLYDSSYLSMNLDGQGGGAECVKNGTGHPARGGHATIAGQTIRTEYNNFVSADRAFGLRVIPMLLAIHDFNKAYGGQPGFIRRWPKFSGEQKSEVDIAVNDFLAREILGEDTPYVIGAGEGFRDRGLEHIYMELGPACGFTPYAFSKGRKLAQNPDLDPLAQDYKHLANTSFQP